MARVRNDIELLIADGETMIKDGLRGARHLLRRKTLRRPKAADPVSRGLYRIARKVDGVFTLAERTALTLLRPGAPFGAPARAAIADYPALLGEDDAAMARSFVETHYRLAKAVLGLWDLRDAFVSEQEVRLAFQIFLVRDRDVIAAARAAAARPGVLERGEAVTEFAAAAALAILRREPVRVLGASPARPGTEEGGETSVPAFVAAAPSRAVFLAVALAVSGYAARGDRTADPLAFLVSATAIIEARWAQFSKAPTSGRLAAEFRRVIPAMP